MNDNFWKYFKEIYADIPRQGPGDRLSTRRALRHLPHATPGRNILDIGCGTGAQTIHLARLTDAHITAVDNHPPFLAQLKKRATENNLASRITTGIADMGHLPFSDHAFDTIWAEGSIFIIGFARGLSEWRRLLVPGGCLVVSDFCWLTDNPHPELEEMLLDGCPEAGDRESMRRAVKENGYRLLHEFLLPHKGWWNNYYVPLHRCLLDFRKRYAGNPEAIAVADHCQREIDLYRAHKGAFGYVFFVMQRRENGG